MGNIINKARAAAVIIMTAVSIGVSAQATSLDPLWEKAVIDGNIKVNKEVKSQTTKLVEIAALQNTMALHFNAIKDWQRKYNNYLKTAQGYAEALNAGTTLYAEAVKTLRNLMDLKKAMTRNPEGIAATLSMNNLYVETVSEFIKTFRMLKFSISTGGEFNMLTGKERTEMLWALVDRMDELNNKVRMLVLSVAYYRVSDIWAFYTRGIIPRDRSDIADRCLERWNRVREAIEILN